MGRDPFCPFRRRLSKGGTRPAADYEEPNMHLAMDLANVQGGIDQIDQPALFEMLGLSRENLGAFHGKWLGSGDRLAVATPIDGRVIGHVTQCTEAEYDEVVARAQAAFEKWRTVPAPKRGEVVRQVGQALRALKQPLSALVALEMGKIRAEAEGEVQEMIDICDFAVGLSRQLLNASAALATTCS